MRRVGRSSGESTPERASETDGKGAYGSAEERAAEFQQGSVESREREKKKSDDTHESSGWLMRCILAK